MKFPLPLLLAVFMASGCASRINLNEAPVEDRAPVSVSDPTAVDIPPGQPGSMGAVEGVSLSVIPPDAPEGERARSVYFDYDSAVVKPEFAPMLDRFNRYLKGSAKRKLTIEGHTDERGGREYNLALGQRRADAVRKALIELGANPEQLESVSYGKEKLAATGGDEASQAKNRRAELNP